MKKTLKCILALTVVSLSAPAVAEEEGDDGSPIIPVEIYVCSFNDGQVPAALDAWVDIWNGWMDANADGAYSAFTLTPFFYGPDQDFDFIWLGVSPDAASLGSGYDNYLANAGDLERGFQEIATCGAHLLFASMMIKEPADDDSKDFVLSFTDCEIAEGKSFDDVHPALQSWAEYRGAHGSEAGMWVLWAAYGGGDAEFDFKFVVSHPNHASLGADFDQYGKAGYAKADELFAELVSCDDARVYNARTRREGMPEEE